MVHTNYQRQTGGFVTLLAVTLLGLSLLSVSVIVSDWLWGSYHWSIGNMQRLEVNALTESCRHEVVFRLIQNPTYRGDESFAVAGGVCTVAPLAVDYATGVVLTDVTVSKYGYRQRAQSELSLLDIELSAETMQVGGNPQINVGLPNQSQE